eukprot:4282478-Prymnesium_polylepis.1
MRKVATGRPRRARTESRDTRAQTQTVDRVSGGMGGGAETPRPPSDAISITFGQIMDLIY